VAALGGKRPYGWKVNRISRNKALASEIGALPTLGNQEERMKLLISSLAVIGLSASPALAQTAQPNAMSVHETTKTTHVQDGDFDP